MLPVDDGYSRECQPHDLTPKLVKTVNTYLKSMGVWRAFMALKVRRSSGTQTLGILEYGLENRACDMLNIRSRICGISN